jgi:outer membrane biosynthesis protein TonB
MRTPLPLLIVAAFPAFAQTDTNIACIERLDIPAYPPLAKQARISGAVTADVIVAPDGSAQSITSTTESETRPHPILLSSVERSLRTSTFAKTCAGNHVKLVFNFVLSEGMAPIVSFGYPNRFWITAPPMMVQP